MNSFRVPLNTSDSYKTIYIKFVRIFPLFQYQVIARMETLVEDSEYILQTIGVNDRQDFEICLI